MNFGLARAVSLLVAPLALCAGIAAATAGECPGNPNAIGTSRTIVVDPREHGRIGTMDYVETLPLADREVVLTFDDGPIPPYTNRILDILAAECVQATYFMVGDMAKEYPAVVRRVYDAGHTVGTHSMSHPLRFRALSVERGNQQVDNGIAATAAALGDASKLAPFFRFPGFGHTPAAHEHAAELGLMVWGADVPADDWKRIGPQEVARRALQRLEGKGKGILLLHDIHQRTVEALPIILSELKARGFRIVHIVPATAERPATVTAASAWLPNSRHVPSAPVILISEVQDPEGDAIAKKSAMQLCNLNPPIEVASRSMRRHARMAARVAHAELTSRHAESKSRHSESRHTASRQTEDSPRKTASARSMQPKTKQSKVAHAEPPVTPRDKHLVQ